MTQYQTNLRVIALPYLFGTRQVSARNAMALGPLALLNSDALRQGLASRRGGVSTVIIDDQDDPDIADAAGDGGLGVVGFFHGDQMSRLWAQNTRLACEVRKAINEGAFPVGLFGSCSSSLGMLAGLDGAGDIGVVWLDAHDDAATPETSRSGLIEGMPVAMIAGRCWGAYCAQLSGFAPVAEDKLLTVGLHELYAGAEKDLDALPGAHLRTVGLTDDADFHLAVDAALHDLSTRVSRIYLHVDLDVLDRSVAQVNSYMAKGGLSRSRLEFVLHRSARLFDVGAVGFCSFDPTYDDRAAETLGEIVTSALSAY